MNGFILLFFLYFSLFIYGQNGGPPNFSGDSNLLIIDSPYLKEHILTKRLISYEHVREADVIWSKRVWRRIDLREKINHPLYYPFDEYINENKPGELWNLNNSHWSLWTVIKYQLLFGNLTLFSVYNPMDIVNQGSPDGDLFKYPIRAETGKNYLTDSIYKSLVDERISMVTGGGIRAVLNSEGVDSTYVDLNSMTEVTVTETFSEKSWILSKDIVAYDLKEDWFFDKERSLLDVRILGICPVIYEYTNEGGKYEQLFWLYFPHCRFVFNNYFTYNTKNDAQWVSFDDLFWNRQFSSYIYRESNVYERKIDSYRTGVDALRESEKINEDIRIIEHDVWHF